MTTKQQKPPKYPNDFTDDFLRKLVKYLGGDPSFIGECFWDSLVQNCPKLRKKAEQYFEEATTGDPAYATYRMAIFCNSKEEWAEKVIENSKTGDPADAAYRMVCSCNSKRKWAEKVIEQATTGDPADAACCMTLFCGSSRKWAEKVIEHVVTGDPVQAAYDMVLSCNSSEKWAKKVKSYYKKCSDKVKIKPEKKYKKLISKNLKQPDLNILMHSIRYLDLNDINI